MKVKAVDEMAIKFEKIRPGMTLYDVRRNTGYGHHKWSTWPVYIKDVDQEKRTVIASWNGNAPKVMRESQVTRLRAKRPESKGRG